MRGLVLASVLGLISTSVVAQGVPPYDPAAIVKIPVERGQLPPVLTPVAPGQSADQIATSDRFKRAYEAHKSPRIAIFWNRTLSDSVASGKLHVEQESSAVAVGGSSQTYGSGGSSTSIQPYGYGQSIQTDSGAQVNTTFGAGGVSAREKVVGDVQQGSGSRSPSMVERDDWRFESAFKEPFLQAGVKLVDRNTAIRVAGDKSNESDVQRAEIKALQGLADLFIEVLQTYDPVSPTGLLFRISIKDVKSGGIVADLTSDGTAGKDAAPEYAATDRGCVRKTGGQPDGILVALAAMRRLTQAWGG